MPYGWNRLGTLCTQFLEHLRYLIYHLEKNGVDMSVVDNHEAVAIVSTNNIRESLNQRKAHVNCVDAVGQTDWSKLIVCSALDKCNVREFDLMEHWRLLELDGSGLKNTQSLPGRVSLYEGMPVILRLRNLSTKLGITNGPQGIMKRIFTGTCPLGLTYATCVIIEFLDSRVELKHLPKKYFPIVPVSCTFTTIIDCSDGTKGKFRVTRHQLPIQSAFAVVTLGPGRYRRRLDWSGDRPKSRSLGVWASRRTPGVRRVQRSVDSIVRWGLREIQDKERWPWYIRGSIE